MVGKLRGVVNPTHMAVVWDGGLSSDRMQLHSDYKSQRPPMPDDLDEQIDGLMEYLPCAGVASIQQDGVEADDLIATVAVKAAEAGSRVVIASSDKDFFQLVSANVGLFNPADKSDTVWGASKVEEKTGVKPEQVVDWLSLTGDAVDNIPGVPGVGGKTAAGLLARFGSVDGLFSRLGEITKPRLKQALEVSEPLVRRNREMIRLRKDLSGAPSLDELAIRKGEPEVLLKRYQVWGFRSMAAEAEAALKGQGDLFVV